MEEARLTDPLYLYIRDECERRVVPTPPFLVAGRGSVSGQVPIALDRSQGDFAQMDGINPPSSVRLRAKVAKGREKSHPPLSVSSGAAATAKRRNGEPATGRQSKSPIRRYSVSPFRIMGAGDRATVKVSDSPLLRFAVSNHAPPGQPRTHRARVRDGGEGAGAPIRCYSAMCYVSRPSPPTPLFLMAGRGGSWRRKNVQRRSGHFP
jgi:hypothetical protein